MKKIVESSSVDWTWCEYHPQAKKRGEETLNTSLPGRVGCSGPPNGPNWIQRRRRNANISGGMEGAAHSACWAGSLEQKTAVDKLVLASGGDQIQRVAFRGVWYPRSTLRPTTWAPCILCKVKLAYLPFCVMVRDYSRQLRIAHQSFKKPEISM